eukprot:CAMPEP_0206037648 /NCGR_PEP_ID=MMETSP1466-20131121/3585_1 /ASSEMBLY_ACC=CAM_ASM_001126 /TAXON_ID=44452 /ORGANISM="Pavlova gyrans, Strain CCMP608" /LENGTH=118 /DNA_ID=CAMNT_0053412211 /DNA_START=290 /DNA_END=646 /DNA_ORIENTATION=+
MSSGVQAVLALRQIHLIHQVVCVFEVLMESIELAFLHHEPESRFHAIVVKLSLLLFNNLPATILERFNLQCRIENHVLKVLTIGEFDAKCLAEVAHVHYRANEEDSTDDDACDEAALV